MKDYNIKPSIPLVGLFLMSILAGCSSDSEPYDATEDFLLVEATYSHPDGEAPPDNWEEYNDWLLRHRPEIREGVGADATAGKGSSGFLSNTANLPDLVSIVGSSELPTELPLGAEDPIKHYNDFREGFIKDEGDDKPRVNKSRELIKDLAEGRSEADPEQNDD